MFTAKHDPKDYPNVKYVATAGEVCPQGKYCSFSEIFEAHTCAYKISKP